MLNSQIPDFTFKGHLGELKFTLVIMKSIAQLKGGINFKRDIQKDSHEIVMMVSESLADNNS